MNARAIILGLLLLLSLTAQCADAPRGLGGGFENGKLLTERHFYLLQADALGHKIKGDDATKRAGAIAKIAAENADTFVLDAYYADSPSDAGLYTAAELNQIRAANTASHPRALLCYLSIGEAENYRAYWKKEWDARNDGKVDAGAPAWLQNVNPKWKGNYEVKYWNAEWQALIFGSDSAALDKIIAQGFDGVYLDIIDGFEHFENGTDNAVNPETNQTYRRDMADFVIKIATYARAKKPGFLVVPQNGTQLLDFADYLDAISGHGQEDLYYNDNRKQKPEETDPEVAQLKKVTAQGKAVLVTDYSKAKPKQNDDIARAQADGFSIFLAPRALNGLGRIP